MSIYFPELVLVLQGVGVRDTGFLTPPKKCRVFFMVIAFHVSGEQPPMFCLQSLKNECSFNESVGYNKECEADCEVTARHDTDQEKPKKVEENLQVILSGK